MAKKGGPVQLQAELNNEDDWNKFLEREGLIIVDVYSEWCGPCSAMTANLKKVKLEGGDSLHLAVAKSDNITCLERFRDKSEPTWMFIVGKKMVNLLFGADAPKLIRLILEELNKEAAAKEGLCQRDQKDITELSPIERERFESIETFRLANEEVEREAKEKAVRERRLFVAKSLLEALPNMGVALVFPKARDAASGVLNAVWESAGLKVVTTDRFYLDESHLEELLYFSHFEICDVITKGICPSPCQVYVIKHKSESLEIDFDSILLEAIYGPSKCPPGSEGSPAQKLLCNVEKTVGASGNTEESDGPKEFVIDGIWVPSDRFCRAIALKVLHPATSSAHIPPEPEPIPPYIAISFDAFKRNEVIALMQEHPQDVMRFGFFTNENPETAKLIAKNVVQFEKKLTETTYGEKMVLQLSKQRAEVLLVFEQLGPSYTSPNSVEGKRECAIFFPKGYDEPVAGGVEEVVKKKSKRKKKVGPLQSATRPTETGVVATDGNDQHVEDVQVTETAQVDTEMGEQGDGEQEGDDGETIDEGEDAELGQGEFSSDLLDGGPEEVDKATSPMAEEVITSKSDDTHLQ